MRICALIAVIVACCASPAGAQAPFMDGAFTTRSADNDPDLIVVREAWDPDTQRQSIYLRVHDGAADHEAFSGLITFRGADVVEVITDAEALADSDAMWGVPGVDYSAGGAARGLEGDDPALTEPVARGVEDVLRVEAANEVRFWFGTREDIDEARVIIEYPVEAQSADFDVVLFGPERGDPALLPPSTRDGIQVGSLVDVTPDDGDYSEVTRIREIKLKVQDLDLIEGAIVVGEIEPGDARAGPALLRVDNFSETDFDQDNGFDQNGVISPIPASADLTHLEWLAGDLDELGSDRFIPADAVELVGLPGVLAVGEIAPMDVFVNDLADTPSGVYSGRLTVWEDDDEDQVIDRGEPRDVVRVTVVVGPSPDFGLDLGAFDATVDAAPDVPDLGMEEDAAADLGLDAGDAALDAAEAGADAGDAAFDAEASMPDADLGFDAAAPDADFDAQLDASPVVDGAPELDRGATPDVTPRDAVVPDAGRNLGRTRGGALTCRSVDAPAGLLLLLLWPVFRRRR